MIAEIHAWWHRYILCHKVTPLAYGRTDSPTVTYWWSCSCGKAWVR